MLLSLVSLRQCRVCLELLYIILFITAGCGPALSQNIVNLNVDSSQFKENYDPIVPVSGGAIVGIRLGSTHETVNIDDIRLPGFSGNSVCVRTVTQDGRFSSNGVYKASGKIPSDFIVRLSPVTIKYAKSLSQYRMDAFALNAFVSEDNKCAQDKALYLPELLINPENAQTLYITVNSGGRFCDIAIDGSDKINLCNKIATGARIAYDTACSCDISEYRSRIVNIIITMDDGFGKEKVPLKVLLP